MKLLCAGRLRPMRGLPSTAWAIAGLVLYSSAALAAAPMPLASHRALYKLSLDKANGSSAPASADGLIAYEFSGSVCEGYTSNFRQMTEMQPQDGATRVTDMRSTTFEDGDGRNFTFKVETLVDGHQSEAIEGNAKKSAAGVLNVNLSRSPTSSMPRVPVRRRLPSRFSTARTPATKCTTLCRLSVTPRKTSRATRPAKSMRSRACAIGPLRLAISMRTSWMASRITSCHSIFMKMEFPVH